MPARPEHLRKFPRITLRVPRRAVFGDGEVLVLEMGLGGAKLEHPWRLAVGRTADFVCGPITTEATIRHSIVLPAKESVVFHSGVQFTNLGEREAALIRELLIHEAKAQLTEWERNLEGGDPLTSPAPSAPRRSAVALRYVCLDYRDGVWSRSITSDPGQPADGVTVSEATPEQELDVLQSTYESADAAGRELIRRIATVAILEQL